MRAALVWRSAAALLLVSLAACGPQLSLDNYNRLQVGQTFDEVKKIVGDPARCDETLGVRTCTWGDEQRGFKVNFALDKVVLMSATNLH
ncbi:MAG: hypothetical protein JOY84_21140 [Curvibacter sp.]|nr:hypothetical protein [Curvibacter sp.]